MDRRWQFGVRVAIVALVVSACALDVDDSSSAPAADPADLRVTSAGWRTDFTKASVNLGEFVAGGPPKDGIPAIDAPQYESIVNARAWLTDRSPVISLAIGDEARAYPLAILMWHEIVNDDLAGVPVLVTFCPLCNTALVFEREVDGLVHDFGTTGNLRISDLVMYDRQTESWWQQATGEALVGDLTGTFLTYRPAQIVGLAEFERAYPSGTVLSRDTGHVRLYGRNPYAGYDTIDQNLFQFEETPLAGPLPPKERVVTVAGETGAVAVPFSELRTVGVADVTLDGDPLVVLWAPGTASALNRDTIDDSRDIGATGVFRPLVAGRRLTFVREGGEGAPIRDRETGSSWSILGIAIDGELEGTVLEPVVHANHFWFAWAAFAPETTIWTAG
jgi:hypothetical protein